MTGSQQSAVETAPEQPQKNSDTPTTMSAEPTTKTAVSIATNTVSDENVDTDTSEETRPGVTEAPSECSECESSTLSTSDKHGEVTCDDCGAIVETRMFPQSAGWKRQSSKEHQADTSVTANNDSGISRNPLGGTIDWKDMDGYGSSLSSKKRSRMHRLRQLDQSLSTGPVEESNYNYALGEINRMAADISVPRYVRDAASGMYETILEENGLTGRSIEPVATAVLYAACEETAVVSRDLSEIVSVSHADHSEVIDTYRSILPELGLNDHGVAVTMYVEPMCEKLYLSDSVQENASQILESTLTEELMQNTTLMEHTAAAVYAAALRSGEKTTQQAIANAADISRNALRARYQEHVEAAGFTTQ